MTNLFTHSSRAVSAWYPVITIPRRPGSPALPGLFFGPTHEPGGFFIDYQNAYRGARSAFFDHDLDPHWRGQFDPLKLGELLTSRGNTPRELHQVRVYRGLPSSKSDSKGYGAARAQISRWLVDPRVQVFTRPLRYRDIEGRVQAAEKGIDVQLAVDFTTMAVRKEYEIGILVSRDTDLKPALEFVMSNDVRALCEVSSWRADKSGRDRLEISNGRPFCHWIGPEDFADIADSFDYSRRR